MDFFLPNIKEFISLLYVIVFLNSRKGMLFKVDEIESDISFV